LVRIICPPSAGATMTWAVATAPERRTFQEMRRAVTNGDWPCRGITRRRCAPTGELWG
jgi:hypothetical protein